MVTLVQPDWLRAFDAKLWNSERAVLADQRWNELVARILEKKRSAAFDAVLEAAAGGWADWKLAEAHVAQHGPIVPAARTGAPIPNPYRAVADDAYERFNRAEKELSRRVMNGV